MISFRALTRRNILLFFKDKGMFFTSLITPLILLLLYGTFLGNVFRDSITSALPEGLLLSDRLLDGYVGGQIVSSILAVSCVTVAFCSNMQMVQDRVTGCRRDLTVSPLKLTTLSVSYYAATLAVTLLVCGVACLLCLLYVAAVGWYLSVADVLLLLLDVLLLTLFGTALSSIINFFLRTQGQISAVGTIVSSTYGFISGAYMPISQFSSGLQKIISFLPGTYGTVLLRQHAMRGVCAEMAAQGIPPQLLASLRDAMDCNLYFFGTKVPQSALYLVLIGAVVLLLAVYVLLNAFHLKKST